MGRCGLIHKHQNKQNPLVKYLIKTVATNLKDTPASA